MFISESIDDVYGDPSIIYNDGALHIIYGTNTYIKYLNISLGEWIESVMRKSVDAGWLDMYPKVYKNGHWVNFE